MRRENEKLIIDGNAIYELDLECVRKKQGKQEGNGRCVEQFDCSVLCDDGLCLSEIV
mgnify:CR=1 FL=1